MRICPSDHRHALLITGDLLGHVCIYKTSLPHLKRIRFILLKRFHAHSWIVSALHFHFSKPVFVSGSGDEDVKIWSYQHQDVRSTLRLVQCIPQLSIVCCTKFSATGLLAVGCENGMLRVYKEATLYSLLWSYQGPADIKSVAWSASQRLAACFELDLSPFGIVQVWNSAFQVLFKLKQKETYIQNCLAFGSNNLLLVSGGSSLLQSNTLHWYYMLPKVMNEFLKENTLPFCRDVLKIIIAYLPPIVHEQYEKSRNERVCITAVSSQHVAIWSARVLHLHSGLLSIYKLDGNESPLFARIPYPIPYPYCSCLAMRLYPGNETAFLLATAENSKVVMVSVIVPQVWIMLCSD